MEIRLIEEEGIERVILSMIAELIGQIADGEDDA